jgi:hypothetical protein
LNKKGDATAFSSDYKKEAEEFLFNTLKRFPNSWLKDYHVGSWEYFPNYTEDIDEAMSVQSIMHRKGYWMQLRSPFDNQESLWHCGFTRHLMSGWNHRPDNEYSGETAPLAICRSALLTVLRKENNAL